MVAGVGKNVVKTIPTLGTVKTVKIDVRGGNPKCTSLWVKPVTEIVESVFNGRRYLWPNGGAYCKYDWDGARAEGFTITVETEASYLLIDFATGSWKNTYESFLGLYDVAREKWIFKLGKTDEVGRAVYEEAKKEAVEAGYTVSNSKPFSNTVAFWLLKGGVCCGGE